MNLRRASPAVSLTFMFYLGRSPFGLIPRNLLRKTGGVGDLFPHHTKRFQSAIFDTQKLAPGFFIVLVVFMAWRYIFNKPKESATIFWNGRFFISHVLCIVVYNNFIYNTLVLFLVLSFIFFFIIECFIIKKLHLPENYQIPIIIYRIIIGLLILFSLQAVFNNKNIYSFILATGSVRFFISDIVLAYYNTVKTMTKHSFALVMANYAIAQGWNNNCLHKSKINMCEERARCA
ncbi:MAG: lysoplasmalogenase family protein [Treponema sp.]|jgi:hypothetical protein|nr:lysoplasmalogenase family protein [Treponema sp.]